ncbi:hypothetical protein PSHT_14869 [Puccinia striiformis]|uniref:Uncharacterized protein n=1 Tax=Puccinia striiformis TaxID=27350 RepID=A0A2S4UI59_9BASI|nr:hypothetical protein PSHT_14869 [Puccinia striiformis]
MKTVQDIRETQTALLTLLGPMKLEKVMIFPGIDTVNTQALLSKEEGRIVSIMSTLIPESQVLAGVPKLKVIDGLIQGKSSFNPINKPAPQLSPDFTVEQV